MTKYYFLILLLAATSFTTGCATNHQSVGEATVVPSDRIVALPTAKTKDIARVVVVRDSGLLGAALDKRLLINDEVVALLSPGEKVEFDLDAGDYVMGVIVGPPGFMGRNPSYLDQKLEGGKVYHYRLFSDTRHPNQIARTLVKSLSQ